MSALAALLAAAACGKAVSDTGGESHFQCSGDEDCSGSDQVCVRARPSDETGECKSRSELTSTGGTSGAGGASTGGASTGGASTGGPSTGGTAGPGSGGANTAGGGITVGQCTSACCPTEESCYGTAVGAGSGRECAALRDNTGESHIQLRQTSVKTLAPTGLTIPIIQQSRNTYMQLPLAGENQVQCFAGAAFGGGKFIQLIDIQPGLDPSVVGTTSGYSSYLTAATTGAAVAQGLCMAQGEFAGDAGYRLDASAMSDSAAFPANLPAPRALAASPWAVTQTAYQRMTTDFTLPVDRASILETDRAGVFFYDAATGRYHSYAKVSDMVQYGNEPNTAPLIIPARELETRITFNDAAHPNCAGGIVTSGNSETCDSVPLIWAGNAGSASATQEGYLLITELEQVYVPILTSTLCVAVMTKAEAENSGFLSADGTSCKGERWDPQAPNNEGLPLGDWCAATNSPATESCHDAFKLREEITFAATKIKVDSGTDRAATCPL